MMGVEAQRAALFAPRSTEQLGRDLLQAEKTEQPTPEERMVRTWIIDEIERRRPDVDKRVQEYFMREDESGVRDERTYGQMINDAMRELAAEGK